MGMGMTIDEKRIRAIVLLDSSTALFRPLDHDPTGEGREQLVRQDGAHGRLRF
jgi:hypothetical protein